MDIFDLHCDYLSRKQMNQIDTMFTYPRMVAGNVRLQAFAIFVSRQFVGNRWLAMLEQAAHFKDWCAQYGVCSITAGSEIDALPGSKRGAILTVEGLDDIPAHSDALERLFAAGVRSLSLTWNDSNLAGDGSNSNWNGGLTAWGRKVVEWCNYKNVLIDASHLSEQTFWDVFSHTNAPLYCSHSNTKNILNHPRNLSDSQILAIIANGGVIGITFVNAFLNCSNVSGIADVIKNVYRICELGGSKCVAFGSDFDGVETPLLGIEHPGKWQQLVDALAAHFSLAEIEDFAFHNAARLFSKWI
jgi:membrane dipeptidase